MDVFKIALLVSCFISTTNCSKCREPENAAEAIGTAFQEIYMNRYLGNFTFFKIPSVKRTIENHWQFTSHNDIGSGNRYYCNNLQPGTSHVDILPEVNQMISVNLEDFERTACRWKYIVTYDAGRIPNYIAEAACQCDKCRRGRCRKVYSYTPIVVKMCNVLTGEYVYQGRIHETPVACMCVNNQRSSHFSGRIASFE